MLPSRHRRLHLALDGRYGDEALELLVTMIKRARTAPKDYEVGLWGGATMFAQRATGAIDVGLRNAAHGRWLLRQHGFRIAQTDIGGKRRRHIELHLADGEVAVRYEVL